MAIAQPGRPGLLTRRALVAAAALALAAASAGCESCSKGGGGSGKPATADAAPSADDAEAPKAPAVVRDDAGVLNVTPLPTASVAQMVDPDGLPAYDGPTGSIEGTVSVTGDPPEPVPGDFAKCPDAEKTWGRMFREDGPTDAGAGARALGDAIVAVTGYSGFFVPVKDEAATVTIEDCAYTRRTVTMTFGQRLEVKNLSKEFWTPVLAPGSNMVMMMAPPKGDPVKIYPKKPGHYLLLDHDRKYAVVDVYVFLHPLHASTDVSGHYRIDGLPVGKVTVNATHPRFTGETSQEIEVRPGVIQKVDLVLHHVAREAGAPDAGARDAAAPVLR